MTSYASTDDGLRWWAKTKPGKTYLVCGDDRLSYAEVDAWVDRVATALAARGVAPGERVGVIGWNSIEWVIASLAIVRLGGVHAAMGERSVATEIRYLTEFTETRTVYVAESHLPAVQEALSQGAQFDIIPMDEVVSLRNGEPQHFERPLRDASEVAIIVYSSGSTGMPKGIGLAMEALLSVIQEWALTEGALGHEGRILLTLPLAPMGGFINSILRAGVVGSTCYFMPRYDERVALQYLIEESCDSLMAPPIIFQRISALPEFQQADLSTLTYAIIGGAPVPLDEFDKWFARGAALRQCYGSTECGGHFTVMSTQGARENRAGCGNGNIYRNFRIARADGSACPPGESGEVLVRGLGIMSGYWANEEATAAALRNGWLHTGDLGCVDANGVLAITDRIKEVIITGGFNVGPTEVENVLGELAHVQEAAVMSVPDHAYGEGIGAIIRLKSECSVDQIVTHCRSRLAGYKVPRYVLIVDEPLARTPGKGNFAKAEIRQKFGDALAAAAIGKSSPAPATS